MAMGLANRIPTTFPVHCYYYFLNTSSPPVFCSAPPHTPLLFSSPPLPPLSHTSSSAMDAHLLLPLHLSSTRLRPNPSNLHQPHSKSPPPPPPLLPLSTRKHRNNLHFRLSSAISSTPTNQDTTIATAIDDAISRMEERKEEDEKFDWFSQWYPLAPVCDLDKRVPHAKTVMGLDVVVWWNRVQGRWQVFEDSCPHRLAPLSEGRIDQWGRLQCVYHGWCFDGEGSCKLIPQAPLDGPPIHTVKKACASVYPSVEQNKIVWFWPSTDPQYKDISTKKKPPYIPELDDPSYTSTMGIRDIPYGYEVLMENLMDPSHVPYAHYGIMRIPKRKDSVKVDREGGRPLDIAIQALNISGFSAKQENGWNKFTAPCVFCVFPTGSNEISESSKSIKEDSSGGSQKKQRRFLLIFICIPVSPGRSRLIWVFPRNIGVWIDRIIPRWMFHVGQNLILDSDLYLLHLEEHKIAKVGPSNWQKACFVPTKSDALVVGFRKWLRKYSDGQVNWGNMIKTDLPPSPPREQLMDRYQTHVVQCSSCNAALKGLKALEVSLQVISIVSIGIVAAIKQNLLSTVARNAVVTAAVLCFVASRWLSHFIYKNFYYHDYNHALR